MTEMVAYSKLNEGSARLSVRRSKRVAPMARMSASFERDNLGREVVAVYAANHVFDISAAKTEEKAKPTFGENDHMKYNAHVRITIPCISREDGV